jgi:hypothetical protein
MRHSIILVCAIGLAGCNQSPEKSANTTAATASPSPKKAGFCFFKPEETKGWKASVDSKGNITVTGKAHVKDSRYVAQLGDPVIAGSNASLALSIAQNSGAYGATEDWWDVKASVAANPALKSVSVICGAKTLADLPLKTG